MRKLFLLITLLFSFQAFGANCVISEYANLVVDSSGRTVPVAAEPALRTQLVAYTTSTASLAFTSATKFIRIICDAKAHFKISGSPAAAVSSPWLPSDTPEYFGVRRNLKAAFYDGTS